ISVSDGISMGHDGMHYSLVSREVIADSVETVFRAEQLDGAVLLAGCDKSEPGMLMAAARLDVAAVFLYAGSTLPGRLHGRDVTIVDAGEAVVHLVDAGITARTILTREAFENAIAVVMALGGSTNAVLHLLAIANEAKVPLDIDDFNRVGDKVPHLADVKPFGRYVMTDI